jgi:hypothetical protein
MASNPGGRLIWLKSLVIFLSHSRLKQLFSILSRRGMRIFLFTTASRTALVPTQPPLQWVPEALSLAIKRPERESGHSPSSSAEVKNAWNSTSTPQYIFVAWCSVKHRDNFTFTFSVLWVMEAQPVTLLTHLMRIHISSTDPLYLV